MSREEQKLRQQKHQTDRTLHDNTGISGGGRQSQTTVGPSSTNQQKKMVLGWALL